MKALMNGQIQMDFDYCNTKQLGLDTSSKTQYRWMDGWANEWIGK